MASAETLDIKIDALGTGVDELKKDAREFRSELGALRSKVDTDIGTLRNKVDSDVGAVRDRVDGLRGEMHAGFAALRDSVASVQASIESLRATLKTVGWAVSVVGMLAIIFFTAGKSLHWFESGPRQSEPASARAALDGVER